MTADYMVWEVWNMFNAFCEDQMGMIITSICCMGAAIAMFRVLRRGAGG